MNNILKEYKMTTIPKQAAKSETQIKSIFLELEKYRLKMFKKFSIYCTVLITLLITFWTLGYINNKENSDILIWTITIIVAGWYFFCKDPLKEYRRYYKKRIIPIVLKPYGGKFYSEFGFFPVDDLKKFYITPWFDDNDLEDSFEYKVEDVKAQFSEIKLYNRYGGYSRNTYYRTKFKGAGIFIEMPFEFKSNIIKKAGVIF